MPDRLPVRARDLVSAMEDVSSGVTWYLDRRTGEVLREGEPASEGAPAGRPLAGRPDRYVPIEPIRPSRARRIAADFVEGLPGSPASRRLARVLRGRKPLAGFERALADVPAIREEWHSFKDLAYRQMAEDWLELEEIDAELAEG